MFKRTEETKEAISFSFDGAPVEASAGESVAAALLAAGHSRFRESPVSGAPRAPFCMMGVCFDCLVTVDGVPNRQACLVTVTDGMAVTSQKGAPTLAQETAG